MQRVRLFPSANLVSFGRMSHARGKWRCRGKPGRAPRHAQAYRGTLYRVSKHQIRRGQKAVRSSTGEGMFIDPRHGQD